MTSPLASSQSLACSVPGLFVRLMCTPARCGSEDAGKELPAKDAALLAKLAIDGPQPRQHLCALLWPDSSPRQAADSLRQRISRLNRSAGTTLIETGDPTRLAAGVRVDASSVADLNAEALMGSADLLAGCDFSDHEALDKWVAQARKRLRSARAQALTDHAETLQLEGRLRDALPLARRICELDPDSEHGWRRLMRLHYLRNDRSAAKAAFWELQAYLRSEHGSQPSEETQQLMKTVESGQVSSPLLQQPVPASVLHPPVLVGRQEGWQAMAAAWDQSQPFLLVGEAGVGKSRLLAEFMHGRPGLVHVQARPGDEGTPYALLGRALVAIDEHFHPQVPNWQRQELGRMRAELGVAPAGPAQVPMLWSAVERFISAAMKPQPNAHPHAAVPQGLQALVLDDLHDADSASLECLRWLSACKDLQPLRLGLATRPWTTAEHPLQSWLTDSRRPVRIGLEPLSALDLRKLLASLGLPALLDDVLCERLYRHAGGHPLFTLATLQELLSSGLDLRGLPLPRSGGVHALLDQRLRQLPSHCQDLLRVAAVAGSDLRADLAAQVLGCSVLELNTPWAALEAANVLRGEAFTHDLVHEAAQRAVPQGLQQALHRQIARLLSQRPGSAPARIAEHWEQGGQHADAAHAWQAAGKAAQTAGRPAEQLTLLANAARCFEIASDRAGRFEALLARVDAIRLLHGGQAALTALDEVEALADTGLHRLRCRMARAAACLECQHLKEAAALATQAVADAALHPALQSQALSFQAEALAHCGRFEEALAAAAGAAQAARREQSPEQELLAYEGLSFVHYLQGHLSQAVVAQKKAVVLAEQLGRRGEAAAGEGHVAALLASVGDIRATYEHALRAGQRHRETGVENQSTMAVVNHIMLGSAAASLGHFDEALMALERAVADAGPGVVAAAQAKARIGLAQVWLRLGKPQQAREAVAQVPEGLLLGLQMQAELVRARAAQMEGLPAQRPLQAIGALAAQQGDVPLVQSAWFEWSFQGEPREAIEKLQLAHRACDSLGLPGTAAALKWRELCRWLELPTENADRAALALALALELQPLAQSGLSAKCHPPETWWTLIQTFERCAAPSRAQQCARDARQWLEKATQRVPPALRSDFTDRHPIHRQLLTVSRAC